MDCSDASEGGCVDMARLLGLNEMELLIEGDLREDRLPDSSRMIRPLAFVSSLYSDMARNVRA
jgi:hypothetical protein